jgi:type I restriction enzyme S subunit
VNPSSFPGEEFELYSIPAHDRGGPEVAHGSEIGSSKQIVQPGDVMISKIIPHIRRARVVGPFRGKRQIASGEWIVFRGESFDPNYLRHFLLSDGFHGQFMNTVAGVGGSLVRARPAQVKAIALPLPPIPEQRRIAAILDRADTLRAIRRRVLTHLEALTRSIFNDMFGSQSWPTEALGDRLQFLTSGSRGWAKYYAPAGDKFIRIQNVKGGYLSQRDLAYVVTPDTAEARRTAVQAGDVLLSITADLGRTAVVPNDIGTAYINQHLAILRAPSLNPRYLADFLESPAGQREVLGKDRGATKAGLNFDDVRSVSIPIPPAQVQACYAERVERITKHRRDALAVQATFDELFVSIQSRAFQGEL